MYVFTDLHQRIALWPKPLFPRCPILDCSILNPFSKCVFVLSRILGENAHISARNLWDAFRAVGLEKGRMLERSYPSVATKEGNMALQIF